MQTRSILVTACGGAIAMAAAIGIGRFVYTPILPPMIVALGLGKFVAGLIASANFAGYLVGALAVSRLSLPGPPTRWLIGALLASAITTAAMGLSASVPAFIVLRFLGGVASAVVLILASALVLDRISRAGRPGLGAVHFSGVGLGIALSAALVAVLSGRGLDWQALWWGSGALSLICALVVPFLMTADPGQPAATPAAGAGSGSSALRRMTIAYGLFGFGYVITATFLVAIVRETPAIRALEPVIWIVVGLAAAPSVMAWTWIGRRFGTSTAFSLAALTEALGVLATVGQPGMAALCMAGVLLGGTFMGLTALGLMRARELATGDPRRAMAAMTASFGIGQIVGPAVAGFVSDLTGGFSLASVLAAFGLGVAAWLARR